MITGVIWISVFFHAYFWEWGLVRGGVVVRLPLRSLLRQLCHMPLADAVLVALPLLMINNNTIKVILMKSSNIKMCLNKHCCVLPRVWNSIHMLPFDPCYCSH